MAKAKQAPETKNAADYIVPLYMNGLQGRMLHMPAPKGKKREVLFIYGHHSTLERWWGVVQDLNQYGAVTMPDLPGFGGMESFYKIGEQATIDNLADYLAAFIKMRYKRKRVTVAGLSFGFVIVTRMLQRYPDLTKNIDMLVSVVGFSHHDDFTFSKPRLFMYRWGAAFFTHRLPAIFFRNVFLHPWVLRSAYSHTRNARQKFQDLNRAEHKKIMNFEIYLWHVNDVRTRWRTVVEFLTLDNCHKQVNLPVYHITVKNDRYFDRFRVEQHMKIIFSKFTEMVSDMDSHAPSVIADAVTAAPLLPPKLRKILAKSP